MGQKGGKGKKIKKFKFTPIMGDFGRRILRLENWMDMIQCNCLYCSMLECAKYKSRDGSSAID